MPALVSAVLLAGAAACGGDDEAGSGTDETASGPGKVGVVIETGSENDDGFNEFALKGARDAASEGGAEFDFRTATTDADYERHIQALVDEGSELVVTVGFRMGDATARVARRNPEVHFAIVDVAFFPGAGCPEAAADCYSDDGGLGNVTSLVFDEDQLGFLAGTLAGCMTASGTVASVGGIDIPPVVRFVEGFQSGAEAVRPDVTVLSTYLPTFDDVDAGKVAALTFFSQGADVVFAAAGLSGVGALEAAVERGQMAIGVDVDQYYTVPSARPALLSSASKNIDVATAAAVRDFLAGDLEPGIRTADIANGGIGLAPFHDWEDRIPESCQAAVTAAEASLRAGPDQAEG